MSGIVSLCSGIGGLDRAVSAVTGERVVCAVEFEPHLREFLQREYPNALVLDDVKTVVWNHTGLSSPAVLTAGFPCQPFSLAGKGLGTDDPRHLWPDVFRAIRELRPKLVVLENVPGLVKHLGIVFGDLASIGFDAEWSVFRASEVGAPHRRDRLFICAWPAADALGQ